MTAGSDESLHGLSNLQHDISFDQGPLIDVHRGVFMLHRSTVDSNKVEMEGFAP
jgi:hypothetical protein